MESPSEVFNKIFYAVLCSVVINILITFYVYLQTRRKKITTDSKIKNTASSPSDDDTKTFSLLSNSTSCWITNSTDKKHTVNITLDKSYLMTSFGITLQQPHVDEDTYIKIYDSDLKLLQYNSLNDCYFSDHTPNGLQKSYVYKTTIPTVVKNATIEIGSISDKKVSYTVCDISLFGKLPPV